MMIDQLIVGAGPAGLKVAEITGTRVTTLVLEEHYEIGSPVQCTGLLSKPTFSYVRTKSITNKIRGAIVTFKNTTLEIEKHEPVAFVVDRKNFDKDLARAAINNNVEILLKAKVVNITKKENIHIVTYRHNAALKTVKAKVVVGADGYNSIVRKYLKQHIPKFLGALQVRVSGVDMNDEFVKIFIGNDIAPGFFGWIVPEGDKLAKVGVALYKAPAQIYLKKILRDPTLTHAKILGIEGGTIPLGLPAKTVADNVLLVGDAGGFVKATSGGGIYMGLKSSISASTAILNYFQNNDNLANYQKLWKRDIGRELQIDWKIHNLFSTLSDKAFKNLFKILNTEKNITLIEQYGDIDHPSKVGFKLIKENLSLLKYVSKHFFIG